MSGDHGFWWLLTWACVAWYSTITIYVAYRGFFDIKEMLQRLADQQQVQDSPPRDSSHRDGTDS